MYSLIFRNPGRLSADNSLEFPPRMTMIHEKMSLRDWNINPQFRFHGPFYKPHFDVQVKIYGKKTDARR